MATKMYIKDYPRPQFFRTEWTNLNGEWCFGFDYQDNGEQAGWAERFRGDRKIAVPFTYETKASRHRMVGQ